jgi:hypothetical protein
VNQAPAGRHLSREALTDYLSHAPAVIVVPGAPVCRIEFDPPRREMSLSTPHQGQDGPDLTAFEHVHARVVREDGLPSDRLTVHYGNNGHEAYLLLSDIADMIQQYEVPFAAAVRSALATFGDLLTRAGGLSPERQTGLYGELLFLEACLQQANAAPAVEAWKGFAPSEHDFVFPHACFEIKTTTTEKRQHTIGSLSQLVPSPGTQLWLVSVQLTSATSAGGRSLTALIDSLRAAAGPARTAFEAALQQAGWRERDRPLYRDSYRLRSVPAAHLVDSEFPVLDRHALENGCARPGLIVAASYVIDITAMAPGEPPHPADHFVRKSD